ncbi:MAG: hypothetical protein WCP21_04850 [Armatimonadota bacterium]
MRRLIVGLAVWLFTAVASLAQGGGEAPVVVASCDFEGPYTAGEQQVQDGCINNWQWGRKDMLLKADRDTGRPGTVQRVQVRGIASGGMQFFYSKLALKKGRFYRVSHWLKSDGLEGPVRCFVRKIGGAWTTYLPGGYVPISPEWKQYSFVGQCAEDVADDVGVCWEGGSLGTIWLDDLKVEEATTPFPAVETKPVEVVTSGNLLPRSSFEGKRDHVWSSVFSGWNRNGAWEGVEGDWEDPYYYRAEGGKVGKYCMAVPNSNYAGQPITLTIPFDVLPGKPYTLSLWMRSDPPGLPAGAAMMYYLGGQHMNGVKGSGLYPKLTAEWQRFSVTATPEPPVGAADPTAPVQLCVQVSPPGNQKGTVYVDGMTLEPGATNGEYMPAHPLELYADLGQDSGNLLQWGQRIPLTLLAAAADTTPLKQARVEVTVHGYPDKVLWRKTLNLPVGQEQTVNLDLKHRGLMRVEIRSVDPALAAPQETVLAVVPKPRDTGRQGMFGTHVALRPALVKYARQLGFTWTRLHDCSLVTKWTPTEREPGKFLWHDAVVDGVLKGGLNLLGLPDSEPEWAKVKTAGANPLDTVAFEKYCQAVAAHYAGKIDYWETWNEPYMGGSYSGGPELFGEVLQAGYRGLKAGNPNCKVVGWCADISGPKWGEGIAEETRKSIDIFSFHNYLNNLVGGGTVPFVAELPEHRKQWPAHVTESWNSEGANAEVTGNGFYTT